MSNRKSKGQNRNRSNNTGGSNGNQGQSKKSKKRSRGKKRQDPRKFWGDVERLPDPPYELEATSATDAVVTSLGRPPIPGHETTAGHYFKLVYDRSVGLAFALAAAGGLDQAAPELADDANEDEDHGSDTDAGDPSADDAVAASAGQ